MLREVGKVSSNAPSSGPVVLFFDSCPGRPRFRQAYNAVAVGMNIIAKALFTFVFAPSYFILRVVYDFVLRRRDPSERLRNQLLREDILPPWTIVRLPASTCNRMGTL